MATRKHRKARSIELDRDDPNENRISDAGESKELFAKRKKKKTKKKEIKSEPVDDTSPERKKEMLDRDNPNENRISDAGKSGELVAKRKKKKTKKKEIKSEPADDTSPEKKKEMLDRDNPNENRISDAGESEELVAKRKKKKTKKKEIKSEPVDDTRSERKKEMHVDDIKSDLPDSEGIAHVIENKKKKKKKKKKEENQEVDSTEVDEVIKASKMKREKRKSESVVGKREKENKGKKQQKALSCDESAEAEQVEDLDRIEKKKKKKEKNQEVGSIEVVQDIKASKKKREKRKSESVVEKSEKENDGKKQKKVLSCDECAEADKVEDLDGIEKKKKKKEENLEVGSTEVDQEVGSTEAMDSESAEADKAEDLDGIEKKNQQRKSESLLEKSKKKNKGKKAMYSDPPEAEEDEFMLEVEDGSTDFVLGLSAGHERAKRVKYSLAYAVQCNMCMKLRRMGKREYETINSTYTKRRFECSHIPGRNCEQITDFETEREKRDFKWIEDRRDVPIIPGFERSISVRSNCSRTDVYYHYHDEMRKKRSLRSKKKTEAFLEKHLEAHPNSRLKITDFRFHVPVIDNAIIKEAAEEKQNKSVEALNLSKLAMEKEQLGDYEGAHEDLVQSAEMDPTNKDIQNQLNRIRDRLHKSHDETRN